MTYDDVFPRICSLISFYHDLSLCNACALLENLDRVCARIPELSVNREPWSLVGYNQVL